MNLKTIGMYASLCLAALTAYFGFTYSFGLAAGTPAETLDSWLWAWAGTASIALAVTLATFAFDISDAVALSFTRRRRGRHAR